MMILRINIYFKYSTNNNIFIFIYNKFCRRIKAPLLILIGERFNFIKYISFITSFRHEIYNGLFSLLNMIHGKKIEYKFPKTSFKERLTITS
ncbi:hypothetical protein HmCmsJML278_01280 [Escherichia coli]|nr:hypothetical protein ExPECSC049_04341 [Escherichia coli]GCQ07437.1 hypothetical protein ExPECSC067_00358 [Escherichia coli]GCQ49951.1 hypothetical protein ExPECSC077_01211 [Escherichia coli]GCW10894.1 hypothetical protein HmCmsJML061_03029 [Escherichia coli]GCW19102.1 hypothetical protein HmCmsJML062_00847 [Escherichia coli]